mgnify:CR=1 FL=1
MDANLQDFIKNFDKLAKNAERKLKTEGHGPGGGTTRERKYWHIPSIEEKRLREKAKKLLREKDEEIKRLREQLAEQIILGNNGTEKPTN